MNITIRFYKGSVIAGPGQPTRVMALVGMSNSRDYASQAEKIDALAMMTDRPDIIADLRIVPSTNPLWRRVVDVGCAAATLPVYTVKNYSASHRSKRIARRGIEADGEWGRSLDNTSDTDA